MYQSREDRDISELEEKIANTGRQIEMLRQRRRERLAAAGAGVDTVPGMSDYGGMQSMGPGGGGGMMGPQGMRPMGPGMMGPSGGGMNMQGQGMQTGGMQGMPGMMGGNMQGGSQLMAHLQRGGQNMGGYQGQAQGRF